MLQEAGHIKNVYYIYSYYDFLAHLMNSEVAWAVKPVNSSSAANNT